MFDLNETVETMLTNQRMIMIEPTPADDYEEQPKTLEQRLKHLNNDEDVLRDESDWS